MPNPPIKKPPVAQVLVEMALHAGTGIGSGITITEEAGAFWNKHHRSAVRLALSTPGSDWSKDRKNVLRVAVVLGKAARRLALKENGGVIDKVIAEKASNIGSSSRICPSGGGKHCP